MQYDVYYLSSVTNSAYAADIVTETFDELKEEMTRQKIQEAGLDIHKILEPVAYEKRDTASSEQSLGSVMGSVLPFMLIISLLMGTMYPAILVCMLAIFAFSLFISAITMCVTSFAKSYKEANNYITPLMLVVMFTGYIGFIPNIELTQSMAMMPVANICLLIKNMLAFKVDYAAIAVVLISNVAYAVIAILFLSKIYDSEAILFSEQKGSLQLFEKRSNLQRGGVPTVSDVWFIVALTILLVLYAGSLLQLRFGLAGLFGTQMLLLFTPLAIVVYTKRDVRRTYGFAGTKVTGFIGAAFLVTGFFPLNIVLASGLMKLFPTSTEYVETAFSGIMGDNVFAALFVIALAPAVCEEMLFRGLILHALKARYRAVSAIVITAALFGAYHMSLVKFIPTGLLGLLLCYVVWRTGSIYPAMLMHFLNNAFSVVMTYYPDQVSRLFPMLYQETLSFSDGMLLCGAGLVLLGIGSGIGFRGMKKDDLS